jgi:transposase
VPALPSWLTEPLWDQFAALLPERPAYAPTHPLGCHRPRINDHTIFNKIIEFLVFGCGYRKAADQTCSATAIRDRRDEWIELGLFEAIETITLQSYDQIIGLALENIPVDGCHTKAPGGECSGPSPVDRRKHGLKRSTATDATGIPLGAVTAPGNRHDSPLLGPTLDRLARLGPLPEQATVHLDAAYGTVKGTRTAAEHGLLAHVAVKGLAAPIQNTKRWPVERTNAWGNQFFKIARCTERRAKVINAYLSLAHAIITLRRLIRQAWNLYRWDNRPKRRPRTTPKRARSKLDSVGDLGGWGQVPRVRQDFERWISCWSRKVWKAVGGLAGEVSAVPDRALRRSIFTAMAVRTCCRWALGSVR